MNKRLFLIVIVLAAIAGLIVVTEQLQTVKPQAPAHLELLPLTQKPLVHTISISAADVAIVLKRTPDNYWISEATPPFLASASKVAQLLDTMNQAKVQREIENTEAERKELELDAGRTLSLQIGTQQFPFTLGKTHSSGGQFILAPHLSQKILLIDLTLPATLENLEWMDLKFLTIAQEQITGINLHPAPNAKKSPAALTYDKDLKKFLLHDVTETERPKLNEAAFSVAATLLTAIPLANAEPLTAAWQAKLQAAVADTARLEIVLTSQTKVLVNITKLTTDGEDAYYVTTHWDDSGKTAGLTKIGAYFDAFIYKSQASVYNQINKGREDFLSITP